MSKTHNAGIVTAYGAAVRGGYTGTYEEFCAQQAQYAENARQMEQAVSDVRDIKTSVESAVSVAEAHANDAEQSATNASNSATQANQSASNANQSAESASQSANNASSSADSASQSATSAQTSATNASTSEQNARQSAEDAQDILDSVQAKGNTQISRVQAKGQEVLDSLPEDFTQVQSDIQNMSVEISNNGIDILKAFPTDTASGAIATFNDGADDIPVKNLTVNIEPVQSGTGDPSPDNVRPISGWTDAKVTRTGKNLFGGEIFANAVKAVGDKVQINEDEKTFTFTRSKKNNDGSYFGIVKPIKAKVITVIITYINNTTNNCLRIQYSDGTINIINLANSNNQKTTIAETSNPSKNVESITLTYYSAGATNVYYDESGVFEGTVTIDDFVPYQGNTLDIDWTDEADTVYGGSLDVTTGLLTVTHAIKSFTSRINLHGNISNGFYINSAFSDCGEGTPLCNMLSYTNKAFNRISNGEFGIDTNYTRLYFISSAFSNATEANAFFAENPLIVEYPLATPVTYQLISNEVKTILGENNIFADTGDISVEYRADIKKYIDKVVATAVSALS